MRDRLHSLADGVGDVVKFEVEEDRHLALGDPKHALLAVGAEEFETELHSAGDAEHVASERCGAVNVRRVDGDEDRVHATGSFASASFSAGSEAARVRSCASMRLRADHSLARMISQVGSQPI